MAKVVVRLFKVLVFAFVLFWIGWFSAMLYSEPKCQNVDVASDLLWPATFKKDMVSQIEYVEILRMNPNQAGQVVDAKIMDNPDDIYELFGSPESSSSRSDWLDNKIDVHWLNVRMADGKLVKFMVFNDSDLSGTIVIENSYCFGFRGIGDVDGAERSRRAFGYGWVKLNAFMKQE